MSRTMTIGFECYECGNTDLFAINYIRENGAGVRVTCEDCGGKQLIGEEW